MTTSGITVFGQPSQPNHGAGGRIGAGGVVVALLTVALYRKQCGHAVDSLETLCQRYETLL